MSQGARRVYEAIDRWEKTALIDEDLGRLPARSTGARAGDEIGGVAGPAPVGIPCHQQLEDARLSGWRE